jgi:hypothetical protein
MPIAAIEFKIIRMPDVINPINVVQLLYNEVSKINFPKTPVNQSEEELKNELKGMYKPIK